LGIKDLAANRAGTGMPIDDVLEGLTPALREHLEQILLAKGPNGKWLMPRHEIIRECAADGYIVTDWSIKMWRRRNGHRGA
jgi:hypothetical protein